jgi:hypothetical protein
MEGEHFTQSGDREGFENLLQSVRDKLLQSPSLGIKPLDATEQAELRKKEIENEALAQNIELKGEAFNRLFLFLAIETGLVFIYGFLQAINWPHGFKLEEWSFKLLIAATITQITYMLQLAVKHLFPTKDAKDTQPQPTPNNE